MKFTTSQTSFKSGRLSSKLFNRVDTKQYHDGASALVGMRVLPEGGVERIPGSQLVWVSGGVSGKHISFTIKGNPVTCVIYPSGNEIRIKKLPFLYSGSTEEQILHLTTSFVNVYDFNFACLGNEIFIVHDSGTLPPVIVKFDPVTLSFVSVQPWEFVPALEWGKYPMADIGSTGASLKIEDWDTVTETLGVTSTDPNIVDILQNSKVIYLEALARPHNSSGYAISAAMSDFYYVWGNITDGVRLKPTTAFPSTVEGQIWCAMRKGRMIGAHIDTWSYNLWRPGNWPRTVAIHEGRVVFGGTPDAPMSIYGSKIGGNYFFNQLRRVETGTAEIANPPHSGSSLPTDPYVYTISSKEDSRITFLESTQALVIGTDRKEYIASGGDTILSSTSVSIHPHSANGSVPQKSCSTGESVYYVSSKGKKLFRFKYNRENGSFVSQDISLLFSDLLEEDSIKQIEWASHLSSLMILMNSGKLYGITDGEQGEVLAVYDTGKTATQITYVAFTSFPAFGNHLLLDRDGMGGVAPGLHVYVPEYKDFGNSSGVYADRIEYNLLTYLDSSLTINRVDEFLWQLPDGTNIDVEEEPGIPIHTHMYPIGTEVYLFDKTNFRYTKTVVGEPSIWPYYIAPYSEEVPDSVETPTVVIGVAPTPAIVATMPVEAGQQWGTAQMGIKNIDTLGIRHYLSYSYEVSSDGENWDEVVVADSEGRATTGRTQKKFTSSPDYDQIVYIRNTKPEPLTITGINMRGVSNDG